MAAMAHSGSQVLCGGAGGPLNGVARGGQDWPSQPWASGCFGHTQVPNGASKAGGSWVLQLGAAPSFDVRYSAVAHAAAAPQRRPSPPMPGQARPSLGLPAQLAHQVQLAVRRRRRGCQRCVSCAVPNQHLSRG